MKTACLSEHLENQRFYRGERGNKQTDVIRMLEDWLKDLNNPYPVPDDKKNLDFLEELKDYFSVLERSVKEIREQRILSASKQKSYKERLCEQVNPYDFAQELEKIIFEIIQRHAGPEAPPGVIRIRGNLKEAKSTAFVLYYFHRRQLEALAQEKLFSQLGKVGRIWA